MPGVPYNYPVSANVAFIKSALPPAATETGRQERFVKTTVLPTALANCCCPPSNITLQKSNMSSMSSVAGAKVSLKSYP